MATLASHVAFFRHAPLAGTGASCQKHPMQSPSPQPISRHRARWPRPLLWGLGGLIVLELLYNGVLVTGLLATFLNRATHGHPSIGWSRAWSLVPGDVYVRNLKLRQEDERGGFWQLDLEDVKVDLSLVSLLRRRLEAESLEVRGLHVRISPAPAEPAKDKTPKGPPSPDPWQVLLYNVRIHEVRELNWKEVQLTGIQEASGNLELVPGHRVSAQNVQVRLGPGQLRVLGEAVARVERGSAGFVIEAPRQEPEGGFDLTAGMKEGHLRFTAALPALEELKPLVSHFTDVRLRGGAGTLEADLQVKEGRLAPGTVIKGSGAPLTLSSGPVQVTAPWKLHSDVYPREGSGARFGLKLTLAPVRMAAGEALSVTTPEVLVLLGARSPRLDEPLPDVHLDVRTETLHAEWAGATMEGRILVNIDARTLAFSRRDTLTFHGSQMQLQDISVHTKEDAARDWEGTLAFPEATLTLAPPAFEGRFTGKFSNASPFVALLTHKGALPGWLSPLLTAKNLALSGAANLGEKGVKLHQMHAKGEGLELRGQAESAGGGPPQAVLLVKMGILAVGVEAGAQGTDIQILQPTRWYEKKTGEDVK
ncbi:hypothetical protein POL68_33805 [Stigmatella sp. ncwal1]|uniref:DUF3971 domain-containing protein n=1 Tax=Stigmatella ashevillensis TaxID=2995309 RepID=A0ABT5DIK3_9BACT|nr:hypothetical protein [Stigmatella ashevillena]MDC0713489.1 hypothetical protein [Stigmatella ashevillena]